MKQAYIFILIAFSFVAQSTNGQQNDKANIEKLLKKLKTAKEDTSKVMLLDDIAWEYFYMRSFDGLPYAKQELELAKKLNWNPGIAISNGTLGTIYNAKAEYITSVEYYLAGYKANESAGNERGMAISSLNTGDVWTSLSDYPKALKYGQNALNHFEHLGDKDGMIRACNNIFIIHSYQKDYTSALKYLERVKKIALELGDKRELAGYYNNLGLLKARLKEYDKALEYQKKSLELNKEIDNKDGIAGNLHNLGNSFLDKDDVISALTFFKQALVLNQELKIYNWSSRNLSSIGKIYYLAAEGNTESAKKLLLNEFNGNTRMALIQAKMFTDSALAMKEQMGDLESLSTTYKQLSDIQSLQGDKDNAFKSYIKYAELKDSVFNLEKDKKLTQSAMQYDFDKKEALAKSEQAKKDTKERNLRNSMLAGLIGTLIFLIVVYRQRNKIIKARNRSEELLHNILPVEVAEELKTNGESLAKQYNHVTVLFTDFVNFTGISEHLSPSELVQEIHKNFTAFDAIMEKYNIEKIKTIGDAYLAVCGLPHEVEDHAQRITKAAIEIREYIANSGGKFKIRIGINSGPVVAGIVGVKKFAYDIWGDTVNTASRMESSGEEGKINISDTTYQLIKDEFKCTSRGKLSVKGKGEFTMYFVDGFKTLNQ